MRSASRPGLTAHLVAAGLLGCAAPDERTTLAGLRREGATVRVSIERDACSCSCGKLICWNFTCSGDGCSSADEYELIVERDSQAAPAGCFEAENGLIAELVGEGAAPLAVEASSPGCAELGFRWRRPPAGLESRPHRIEIGDASATWSIDDPFTTTSLAVIGPSSAVSTSGSASAMVVAGDAITFALTPPVRLTEVHASLRSSVTHASIELPIAAVRDDELEVIVPSDTPSGPYDFQLGAGTQLPSGACHGPAVCRGLDVGTSFAVRVE